MIGNMNSKPDTKPDWSGVIFAAVILAPFIFLAAAAGVDQVHDVWVEVFGGEEWR